MSATHAGSGSASHCLRLLTAVIPPQGSVCLSLTLEGAATLAVSATDFTYFTDRKKGMRVDLI